MPTVKNISSALPPPFHERVMKTIPAADMPKQSPTLVEQVSETVLAAVAVQPMMPIKQWFSRTRRKSRIGSGIYGNWRRGHAVPMKSHPLMSVLCFVGSLAVGPALADGGPSIIVDMAERAIAKGHGTTCGLEMKPVAKGGYYPCLDFGPYRYVRGYGKVYGFVVQVGKQPFSVMSGSELSPAWTYDGPWKEDMPARMVLWWNDTVEGVAFRAESEAAASGERAAAEKYIRGIRGEDMAAPELVQPPAPVAPALTEEMAPDILKLLAGQ